jgi:hypothetical protein
MTTARHKLNELNVLFALMIAALLGGVTGSWAVFWIAAFALILGSLHSGSIRP